MAEKRLNIKHVRRVKFLALGLGLLVVIVVVYFPNYAKLRQLKLENQRLLSETEALEKEITDYQKKIGKVGKDSHLYEEIARDNLGVARDNEIVIDIKR